MPAPECINNLCKVSVQPVFPLTFWLIGACLNFLKTVVPKAVKTGLSA